MKLEFFIAGVQYRPREEINKAAGELKKGEGLELIPEPDNKFDPNAVMIVSFANKITDSSQPQIGATFLGYVPKKFSSEVAGAIEAGLDLFCTVTECNPSAKTYEMFKVKISDEEPEIEEEPCWACGEPECICDDEDLNDVSNEQED